MRIISGKYKSRSLEAPPGLATRPTSDRLRETLFNVLAPRIEGAVFLDLYAGSGAVGLEALSRGAESVIWVERSPAALKALRKNIARLGAEGNFRVHAGSVNAFLGNAQPGAFDLVFLDPPYDATEGYETALGLLSAPAGILAPHAMVIAEHRRKQKLADAYGVLKRTRLLEQGDAALSFYRVSD